MFLKLDILLVSGVCKRKTKLYQGLNISYETSFFLLRHPGVGRGPACKLSVWIPVPDRGPG